MATPQEQLQTLDGQLTQLATAVAQLQARLDQQPAPAPRRKCPVSLPEKFDGSRDQLPAFLAQAQLYMQLRPEDFPSDQVKVAFFVRLLTGPAAKWAMPYFLEPSPLLANLDGFISHKKKSVIGWEEMASTPKK
uniref:DUF4939 domain-containing protein n=1 Tax=Salvator merianae TaxID=96440 RepID=A0A8D0E5V9_SALMN